MSKRKKKEETVDYVSDFLNNKDQFTDLASFEEGLRAAEKKQREFNAIGKSCTRLAPNIELEFEFSDEERIVSSILKTQRELGLLQDEEFYQMQQSYTPFQVESYHEKRKKILEEGREYRVTFFKNGNQTASIGTPNIEVLAQFIAKNMAKNGLHGLSGDTAATLFFHQWRQKSK